MKKSVFRKISVFFLALCMVLTEGHLSYLGNALGLGKGVGTARAAVDWTYDDEYTLYNFANINGSNQFGLLRRTYINTLNDLDYYVSTISSGGDAASEIVSTNEILNMPDYDFSGEVLYVTYQGTNNVTQHSQHNGTYIYSGDIADYCAHPENYPSIDGVYYVTEVKPVIIVRKKIGASGFRHLTVDNEIDTTGRKSYHRDFGIKAVKGVPENQVLFNFLDIKGVTNGNNLYRLVNTSSIAYIPASINTDFLINPSSSSIDRDLYDDFGLEEYDFESLVLDINKDGTELSYVYKPSSYAPEDEFFEPYYTIEIKKLSVETQLNHSGTWFENPDGWIGGEEHPDWDGYPNNTTAYHRDYIATLHKSNHKVKVVWKDYDGTTLETDNNVTGGTVPHYDGAEPGRAADILYDYEWAGWSDGTNVYAPGEQLPKISSDDNITYTAVYNLTPKFAHITGYEGEYDKESHSITVELNDGIDADVEYSVKDKDGSVWSTWSDTAPAETDVCDKQVRVRVTHDNITSEVPHTVALTITKATATVTISGHNNTTVYDGESHSVSDYDFSSTNPIYTQDDFSFNGTASAERTDVGTTNMGLAGDQFTNTNENFENVAFSVTDGFQTITKYENEIVVTITGHNSTTDYDGEEHSVSGYEVSINNDLYTAADFTFSGTAEAKRTDAGTTSMGLTASMFTNNNANFDNDKITFNVIDGYQKIDPINVTVTITGNNSTDDYDGEEHTVTGYTATANSTLYNVNSDITFTGTAEASRTDFGTTNMGLTSNMFSNNNPNFGTVTFEVTDGYQTIDKIDVTVTITGANNACDYDGAEHSVSGYTAVFSSPLYTEADFTFSGTAEATRTNAGTTNMGLAADQFTNTNTNFNTVTFSVTDGYQTINPISGVTVTITGHYDAVNYDGEAHSVSGYDVEISNALYTENDFTFSGTNLINRTDAGTTNMDLTVDQFTNTNDNFEEVTFVIAADGYLTINPISVTVTITGRNNTTDYDGDSHSVSGYDVEISSDLYTEADFTFGGSATAARTDAGTTNMGLATDQFTNTNTNFDTVTFDVTDGYQTINPIDVTVTITGANNACAYDGEEHTVTGYTATADSDLYDVDNDFVFSGTAQAARTDAGTTNMGLAADQFANTNANFGTVTFNVTDGYQTINTIDVTVTITGRNNTTDYDGNLHRVSGYEVEISNDLYTEADFTFSGTAEASRTDAGTSNMGLAEDQFANINQNFGTVTFNVTDGYQKIDPIDVTVTITGHYNSTDYDGNDHTVTGYDVEFSNSLYTEDCFTFSGEATATQQNVGKTNMGLISDQFANVSDNFDNVTFVVTDGYQEITQLSVTVTITGHTDTLPYDGDPHSVEGFDFESTSTLFTLADVSVDMDPVKITGTDAGTYPLGLTEDTFRAESPNYDVTFNVTDGQLVINPVAITIKADNKEKVYDNNPETDPELTADEITGLPEHGVMPDFSLSCDYNQNVGDYDIIVTPAEDTNPNYIISVEGATFKITPAAITIKADDKTKEYDNSPGTDPELTATVTGRPDNGDALSYSLIRVDGQDVDDYVITASAQEGANPNYTITFEDGTFTITPVAIAITADDTTKEYDNDETTDPELTATVTGKPANGVEPVYSLTRAEGQDVDEYTITVTAEANANPNYTITVEDGIFEITPVEITIKADNQSKVYDNDTLTDPELTATVTGVPAQGVAPVYTLSCEHEQNVGDYDIIVTLTDGSNPNYIIATENAKYSITPLEGIVVEITGNSDTFTYDGDEHTVSGYEVTSISNPLYTEADFEFGREGGISVTRTDAGSSPLGLTEGDFRNINNNFDVTFVVTDGGITIDKAEITITADDNTKTYDKSSSSDPDLTATVDGVPSHGVAPVYTLNREPGQNADTYVINVNVVEEDNPNYIITTENGTFTIEPATLTITVENKSKVYDNNPSTDPALTGSVDGLVEDDTYEPTFYRDPVDPDAGQEVGIYNIYVDLDVELDNYIIAEDYQFGTFTITAAPVTIKAVNKEKTYDNDADNDPNLTAEVTGVPDNCDVPIYNLTRAEGQDVGSYDISVEVPDAEVYSNYTIATEGGTFKINPAAITITAVDQTKQYDNNTSTDPAFTATVDNVPAKGVTPVYEVNCDHEQNVGEYNIIVSADAEDNPNYTLTLVDGTYKITKGDPVTVTITGNSETVTYDGTEHTVSGYVVTDISNNLYSVADFEFGPTAEISASRTDVGTTDLGLTKDNFHNTNNNFDVTFEVTDGSITIEPAEIAIKAVNKEKVYDNNTSTDPELTATVENVPTTGVAPIYSLSRVAGQDVNGYTITVTVDAEANPNYTISTEDGIFSITPAEITIKADSKEKTYDNDASTDPALTAEVSGVPENGVAPTYSLARAEGQDADEYEIGVLVVADENPNYTINTIGAIFKINKAVVTIVPENKTKEYDNDPNSDPQLTATVSGTVGNDTITYNLERVGGQDVREYQISVMIGDDYQNYDIETGHGTFTITKRAITIKADNKTKAYDNATTTDPGLTATVTGLPENGIELVYSLSREEGQDVGNYAITVTAQSDDNPFYTITTESGIFSITEAEVVVKIAGHTDTQTYDGIEHTVSGYDVTSISNSLYDEADFTCGLDNGGTASGKNVGTTSIGLTAGNFRNTNNNFTVTFEVTDGGITINPRDITIKADNKSKTYDKNPNSDPELTATVTNAVDGDEIAYSLSRVAGQDVDSYEITVTVNETDNPNYNVTTEPGWFSIEPATLSFKIDDKNKVYDNDPSTDPELTGSVIGLVDGDTYVLTLYREPEDQDVGTYDIYVAINEIGNYSFDEEYEPGKFTITPATVTIKADNKTKTYDNDAATDPELSATVEGTIGEDEIGYILSREAGQDAGEYVISVETLAPEEYSNYTITTENGTFTIKQAEITIAADDKSKDYDNDSLTDPVLSAEVSGVPVKGVAPVYDLKREAGQNAGTYTITAYEENEGSNKNYKITFVDGTFTINAVDVTVTPKDVHKDYDNDPSTDPALTADVIGTVGTETISYTLTREEGQDAGDYVISGSAEEGANPNYNVTFETGTFSIYEKAITIKAEDKSKVYDNDASSDPELTANVTGLPANGVQPVYSVSREEGQDAGEYVITVSAEEAANPNYDITFEGGIFKITKKNLTVSAEDKEKVYDNDASTDPELTVAYDGLVEGDTVNVLVNREEGQGVGEYPIHVAVAETANYNVTTKDGTFNIKAAEITIKADNKTKSYDNNTATDPELTANATGVPAKGVAPVYSISRVAGQDVGEYAITVSAEEAANPNYTVTFEDGTFKITPVAITVKADDLSKTYDNDTASDPELTATVTGLPDNGVQPVYSLSRAAGQDVGEYAITASAEADANKNYSVTFESGKFEITAVAITIKAEDKSKNYDNDTATDPELTATVTGLPAKGVAPVYSVSRVAGQDVGEYVITVSAEADANKNYVVTFEKGTFKINPVAITVKADDLTKPYDNDTTTDPELTANATGVPAKGVAPVYSISRVAGQDVGEYAITVSAEEAANPNYTVTFEKGTFKITPVAITVKADDPSKTYDNDTATDPELTAKVTGLPENGVQPAYSVSRAAGQDVGEYAITVSAEETANPNYTVTFEAGTFKITPAEITIKAEDKTKPYDNNPATDPELTAKATGVPAKGVAPVYSVSRAAGQDVGEYAITVSAEETANPNYEVTFETGTFKITPIDVTVEITGHNGSAAYDNTKHTVSGYDVTFSNDLYTEADFTFKGTAEANRTVVGKSNMGLTPDMFENNSENFDKVTFVIAADGYQEIVKANVTVTIVGKFDVQPYKNIEYTVTGYTATTECEFYDVDNDFTFDGTAEAKRTDAGTTDMGLKADMFTNTNENVDVTFDVTDGYIRVAEADEVIVKIKGHKFEGSYDSTEKSATGYDVEISSDLYTEDDIVFTGNAEVSGKNAGKSYMGLDAEQFTNTNPNFKKVTFIVEEDGYVDIVPAEITVTADDITITEGDSEPQLTISADLFGDDTIDFEITREEGNTPGEYIITVTGAEDQGNYHITSFISGKFTIEVKVFYYLKAPTDLTWTHNTLTVKEFEFARNVDDHTTIEHSAGFRVDGSDVPAGAYTVRAGSVIISLKPEYLQTLAIGKHTIEALFDDGDSVTTEFTIVEQKDVNPSTGDEFEADKLMMLMLGSAACFIVLLLRRRKEEAEA